MLVKGIPRVRPQLILAIAILSIAVPRALAQAPCRITVVDRDNGWPVPMVEVRTTHNVTLISDNAGVIAFDLPELMGRETWLFVSSHGYQVPADGFGFRGIRFTPQPGGELTINLDRQVLAQRLGRLTGSGLFAESQKLGQRRDWPESGIMGCDSIRLAAHRGRLHWVWGDTNLPHYPLGLFEALGATTAVDAWHPTRPPLEPRFDYVRDSGNRPRNTCPVPGPGPTWLDAVVSLPDAQGQSRLVATYMKIKAPLATRQSGLCVWNDQTSQFDIHKTIWNRQTDDEIPPTIPAGHAVRWRDGQQQEWILFGDPFPALRCRPSFESWEDPGQWETLTVPKAIRTVDGKSIVPHRGSIAWNQFRGKWIALFCQAGGDSSLLGEIWFCDAPSPMGPWSPAIKVLSHDKYSFYNPRIDSELTPADAEYILFEGTYTKTFSGNPAATPRYDYNQILYRLDLDDVDASIAASAVDQ